MLTSWVRDRFVAALRELEAHDGIERVDQAGYWGEATMTDGVRYEVHVIDEGCAVAWLARRPSSSGGTYVFNSGRERNAALAWWAGFCAVADNVRLGEALARLDSDPDAIEDVRELVDGARHKVEGTALRVERHEARRHFEAGGEVLVSEHGHERSRPVTSMTTTHTRATTTWEALASEVREWRSRYPNQRFYIVER